MAVSKYWRVWLLTASTSPKIALENRRAAAFFIAGKFLRFGMFLIFLLLLHQQVPHIAGYSFEQMVVFFLTFNLLDMMGQIFFRGIYWFRTQVISGELDFKLIKPMNVLFQVMTRDTDMLDVPLFLIVGAYLTHYIFRHYVIGMWLLAPMLLAALLIITAVHIMVAALGVLTTEVDHTIMIYRDLSNMARVPIDVYTPFVRGLLTFVIPVAVAYTFPAKVVLGLLAPVAVVGSLGVGIVVLILAIGLWRYALTQYSSASS